MAMQTPYILVHEHLVYTSVDYNIFIYPFKYSAGTVSYENCVYYGENTRYSTKRA